MKKKDNLNRLEFGKDEFNSWFKKINRHNYYGLNKTTLLKKYCNFDIKTRSDVKNLVKNLTDKDIVMDIVKMKLNSSEIVDLLIEPDNSS